jgi:predicted  nucleic acid-binding Zn-ribbon protein
MVAIMNSDTNENSPSKRATEASQQVASAHGLLQSLRARLAQTEQRHPELEESISKLEAALNLLTVQTGGML